MRERALGWLAAGLILAAVPSTPSQDAPPPTPSAPTARPPAQQRVRFTEGVARALARNPTVGQAAQAILRAQALLDDAKAVFRPTVYGAAGVTILDDARGFSGNITQPKTQWAFNASASFAFLDAARWAAKNQAGDQVGIARISAAETRRQVAVTAAEAYLAVLSAQRQWEIAVSNLETARALEEYARARLDAGKGSRLNHVRSTQELAAAEGRLELAGLLLRRAQEALGVALFADGPTDADGDPQLAPAAPPASDAWLEARPDVRLAGAQWLAAERVASDSWKDWFPVGATAFTPQYVTPAGFFEPARSWRALFQLRLPIYDGTLGPAKRVREADRESARLNLDAVTLQARAELRLAQDSVNRNVAIAAASRRSAESAVEALQISEIAYRAGATSNIEVVQAQQTARNTETLAALAEDQLWQARLDLLVALGQFP